MPWYCQCRSCRRSLRLLVLLVLSLTGFSLPAQRDRAEVKLKQQRAAIEYGVVRVGRHSLEEFQTETTWRMGRNEASTLITEMPILAENQVVLPGSYRVNIVRRGQESFFLGVDGASWPLNPRGRAAESIELPGRLSQGRPSDKLVIAFAAASGKSSDPNREASVKVHFGPDLLEVPVTLLGARPFKAARFAGQAFTLPESVYERLVAAGVPVPVATLTRPDPRNARDTLLFNLTLKGDKAILAPALKAPTTDRGFGSISLPSEEEVREGTVTWEPLEDEGSPFLEVSASTARPREPIRLTLTLGRRRGTVEIPDPLDSALGAR